MQFSTHDLESIFHCKICHEAKQKHLPFPFHQNRSPHAFDVVHLDIWGLVSVPTIAGYKYFLTIVDDYTHMTWIYLLRMKFDVQQVFPTYYKYVLTQFGKGIKGVRSDNALELQFIQFYHDHGIQAYHSCVETPEQNSVVERKTNIF